MRENVREFVRQASQRFSFPEPILEIGSRPAGGQEEIADVRGFFPNARYAGSDFLPGAAVDVVLDTHMLGVRDESAGSVIMMDTLEHVQDPTLAMREVHRVIQPDGLVIMSSHMAFPIHNHPWDYWRYTPAAFDVLVRRFDSRAVFFQGDPLEPHTVLAIARKTASADEQVGFEAAVSSLMALWPKEVIEGPLVRFEPLLEVAARGRGHPAPEDRMMQELVNGNSVEQTFVCPEDNLARIDVKLSTRGRMNFCLVGFQLKDERTGRVVAESEYYAPHINDCVWVPVTFPAVPSSAGRTYRIVLRSQDGRPGAAVAPVRVDDAPGGNGHLYENGEPAPGTLCFRAFCRPESYTPVDYRELSGLTRPLVASEMSAAPAPDGEVLKRLAARQSEHLWYAVARSDERLDDAIRRLDALERLHHELIERVQKILGFVEDLQSSPPVRLAGRARRLLRRQ
jgi:hypothetical protein